MLKNNPTISFTAILIVGLIFMYPTVSAISVDIPKSIIPINYSLINVNNSNYLQGLTPQQVSNLINSTGLVKDWNSTGFIKNWTTDLLNYVPYTGATSNVDLGAHSLKTSTELQIDVGDGNPAKFTSDKFYRPTGYAFSYWSGSAVLNALQWNYGDVSIPNGDLFVKGIINTTDLIYGNGSQLTGLPYSTVNDTQFDSNNPIHIDDSIGGWLSNYIIDLANSYGFLTSITNIFDQNLNTTSNVSFNKINASGNVNIYGDLEVEENHVIRGQPIRGMLGSGIIDSESNTGTPISSINVTCSGLECNYTMFKVRIQSNDAGTLAVYCDVPAGSVTVPDNTFALYYVD